MENTKLNDALKRYFTIRAEVPEKGKDCPSIENLGKYASGKLELDEYHHIDSHVKNCKFCNELIEDVLLYSAYEKHIKLEIVPERIKNMAKSLNPNYKAKENKMMGRFKKNVWLVLSLLSLVVSFFASQYFMQFMILAVIFGLKWVFSSGSTRALIMVYNAWKKHDKESSEELERIFKGRL